MSGHAILLAGAPDADDIDWDSPRLLATFTTPVKRFLGEATIGLANQSTAPTPTYAAPQWRLVSMRNLGYDVTVPEPEDVPQTQFLTNEIRDYEAESQERLRFLEHSLALLNNLDSSQIAPPEDTTTFQSTYSYATSTTTSTSFGTNTGSFDFSATSPAKLGSSSLATLTLRGDITDLRRIPPADHITRIQPQTMTVNLLAALISISPARTVRLRKRAAEMEIHELLLGDETRAGFSITFWLAPADSQAAHRDDELRASLRRLRAGDVVVWQNVALSAFKGCVYGQSLSRRFARNSTSMSVVDAGQAQGLPVGVRGKYKRVRGWADEFVGRTKQVAATASGVGGRMEELPPDTQSPT